MFVSEKNSVNETIESSMECTKYRFCFFLVKKILITYIVVRTVWTSGTSYCLWFCKIVEFFGAAIKKYSVPLFLYVAVYLAFSGKFTRSWTATCASRNDAVTPAAAAATAVPLPYPPTRTWAPWRYTRRSTCTNPCFWAQHSLLTGFHRFISFFSSFFSFPHHL